MSARPLPDRLRDEATLMLAPEVDDAVRQIMRRAAALMHEAATILLARKVADAIDLAELREIVTIGDPLQRDARLQSLVARISKAPAR
jgi:hypothetical protein